MIQELLDLKDGPKFPKKLEFKQVSVDHIEREKKFEGSLKQSLHDMLHLGGGASWFMFIGWWIIGNYQPCLRPKNSSLTIAESLPFFTRLELEDGEWVPRYWPPNRGARRDVRFPYKFARLRR